MLKEEIKESRRRIRYIVGRLKELNKERTTLAEEQRALKAKLKDVLPPKAKSKGGEAAQTSGAEIRK
jgi:hypothetical protein